MLSEYPSLRLSNTPCHILPIHSLADGHLHCFHFLATIDNAAMNIHIQVLVWMYVSPLLSMCLGAQLLSHIYAILCLTFWGTAKLYSTVAAPLLHYWVSLFPLPQKGRKKNKKTLFLVKTGKYSKIFVNARALWEERVKAEERGTSSSNPQKARKCNS